MSKAAQSIAPPMTHGATNASQVSPAMKVYVCERPNGATLNRRSPTALRQHMRVMFDLIDVSSIKTSRCALSRMKGWRRTI
jgi:hypothetical protein